MTTYSHEVYRNKNRGYQQLRVWNEAIDFYKQTSAVFQKLPYELKRIASQAIASADSVHRNIAEGYCRRSIREYIQYLYISLGSLGESVSGFHACHQAKQISDVEFKQLDAHAYKLENGLLKLIKILEQKRDTGNWIEQLTVKESEELYGEDQFSNYSTTPTIQTLKQSNRTL